MSAAYIVDMPKNADESARAREEARSGDGTFGEQVRTPPEITLATPTDPPALAALARKMDEMRAAEGVAYRLTRHAEVEHAVATLKHEYPDASYAGVDWDYDAGAAYVTTVYGARRQAIAQLDDGDMELGFSSYADARKGGYGLVDGEREDFHLPLTTDEAPASPSAATYFSSRCEDAMDRGERSEASGWLSRHLDGELARAGGSRYSGTPQITHDKVSLVGQTYGGETVTIHADFNHGNELHTVSQGVAAVNHQDVAAAKKVLFDNRGFISRYQESA